MYQVQTFYQTGNWEVFSSYPLSEWMGVFLWPPSYHGGFTQMQKFATFEKLQIFAT